MTLRILAQVIPVLILVSRAAANDIDAPPIRYSDSPPDNAVSRLQARLEAGRASLTHEKTLGYARSLLKELNIPESSQVLVFTKTSLQRHRISPRTPRAIYFNDEMYVGFCQNGDVMELSAVDPNLGTVYYTLDQKNADRPRFTRQGDTCLICHGSSQNQGLPGHMVRSVFSDPSGYPILASGTYRIDQTSPLKHRWGGWYVTGTSGKQSHLGNLTVEERVTPEEVDNKAGLNVTDLSPFFKMSAYLTPHSDIVALMVLEHQTQMHNLITRAGFLTRMAVYEQAELDKALGRDAKGLTDSTVSRIKNAGEPLVKYMLFSEESALTDRLQGDTTFAADFAKRGPFDKKGRSLRDFDMRTRMFKYPCSYLIYSAAFDALPAEVKDYVYPRLWDVLSGNETGKEFAHLSATDRIAIREILVETKPNLPQHWRAK
jgi:hypothetical protein